MATEKINSCFGAQATWPAALKTCCIALCFHLLISAHASAKPFRIQVVDAETSRGIPLVMLESSLHTRHITDSNGLVAFDEPVAMGRQVHFKPSSHGYRFDAPPLAMGGVTLKPEQGSSATIVMQREMIAERLYRITGAGIYKDTISLGDGAPIHQPLLNAGVIGQDSTLCAIYAGKLFWVWGDTSHMRHPLAANFRVTAATSDLPTSGGLPIERGVNLQYFEAADFTKPMVNMLPHDRSAVFWLSCLMNVPDTEGRERLVSWYSRVDSSMKTLERGIVEYDPQAKEFKAVAEHPTTAPLQPGGHAVRVTDSGTDYMLFTSYGEQTRVKATYEAVIDPAQYEALTCVEGVGALTTATARVMRDANGEALYRWKRGTEPTGPAQQRALLAADLLNQSECIYHPIDALSGRSFLPHACSLAYNTYRKKWVTITSELMGSSMLGEIWYMESEKPEGPWTKAVKILTHDNYSFYNPLQHPEMLKPENDGGRYLYFEGTYTKSFSGAEIATPWYDYNQVMYRLDLDDERLRVLETH
jgi:hypothetical protein